MPIRSRNLLASNFAKRPTMAAQMVQQTVTSEDMSQLHTLQSAMVSGTVLQPAQPFMHIQAVFEQPPVSAPPGLILVLDTPQPRENIKVPISPTEDFNDQTLFDDAANPAVKYALPQYAVAEVTLEGQKRYRMAIEKIDNDGWRLVVYIAQQPVESNLPVLEHTLAAELKFGQPIAKSLPLTLEKESETTWKATLLLPETVDRDEVYHALTDAESQSTLLLHREAQVAVSYPMMTIMAMAPLYRTVRRDLSMNLRPDPFIFSPQVHPYIFAHVIDASGTASSYTLCTVEWKGRIYYYLQDRLRPYLFSYLPDSYQVLREPAAPYRPNMRIRFSSADGTRENMRVTIEYVAAPIIDLERLKAATEALKVFLPSPLPANMPEPLFQPLVVRSIDQLELQLALPRADTSSAPQQKRPPGVVTNLTDEFRDAIADLTLEQFQTVLDAMFGESAVIFHGSLLVKGGGVMPDESVPFSARFNDLAGNIFEAFETPLPDGRIQVRLRNSIESPIELRSIPVQILADQQLIDAHVDNIAQNGTTTALPVHMAAGEEITLLVIPNQPVNATSKRDAILDLDDVAVVPDKNAIWSAILDSSVRPEYTRPISVHVFPEWFAPPNDLIAIGVDFDNGDHLLLNKERLEGQAKVRISLQDYILRKVQESEYRYTLIKVHSNGQQTRKVLTDTGDLLILDINA
jgi:hypothetical protein